MTWHNATTPGLQRHPHIRWLGRTGEAELWGVIQSPGSARAGVRCQVFGCHKTVEDGRKCCPRCRKLIWRINNPIQNCFANLRDSAAKKKIPFLLTLEEFKTFCASTGYHETKGCAPGAMHVDRINPLRGYEVSNIRCLEMLENSTKGAIADKLAHLRDRQRVAGQMEMGPEEDIVSF